MYRIAPRWDNPAVSHHVNPTQDGYLTAIYTNFDTMPLEMRTATLEDVKGIAEVYMSAFENDIISRQLFPRESGTGSTFWQNLLADELNDKHANVLVVTDPSSQSPETIIAFAKWVAPGAPIEDAPGLDGWPQDGNPEVAVSYFNTLTDGHRRNMADMPHWYLELVAVRQGWMGKGAAGQLMRWGVERADAEGKACYLDATPRAKGMYIKYGFDVVDQRVVDTPEGQVVTPFMVRLAKLT